MRKTTQRGRGTKPSGLLKPVRPDEALAAVIGKQPQPRSEMTRRIWGYIKSHRLQDPTDARRIRADDTLRPVFDGKKSISMFELGRCLNHHVRA